MTYEMYAKIRDSKGFKDSQVASGAGIGKSTFTDWKKGIYSPKAEKLLKIAAFLNEPADAFLSIDVNKMNDMAEKAAVILDSPFIQLAKRIEALPADKRKALEDYLSFLEQK